ncbi:MAG: hypothetical protein V7K67_06370 [Nostoc sp.]|uniref:hypothetical protein n=1 Tax=Nostoc sp. TaxID=1180 RepID=UPI002FFD1519
MKRYSVSLESKITTTSEIDSQSSGQSILLDISLKGQKIATAEIPLTIEDIQGVPLKDRLGRTRGFAGKKSTEEIIEKYLNSNLEVTYVIEHKHSKSDEGSALNIVLTKLIKEDLPKQGESNRSNEYASEASKRIDLEIGQDELIKQITARLGFAIGRRDMDEVITLMSNFGYSYERVGQTMGFVKEVRTC